MPLYDTAVINGTVVVPSIGAVRCARGRARRARLFPKEGAIVIGGDADLVVIDPEREQIVTPAVLHSAQAFTPFAGLRVGGWSTHTLLRGQLVFDGTQVIGAPSGRYIRRPVGLFERSDAGDRAGHRRGRGVSPGPRAFK